MEENAEIDDRRGRSRGRARGRQRGRQRVPPKGLRINKRNKIESDEEDEDEEHNLETTHIVSQFDQDCDISSLEAPTFTTLDRGPPAPMLRLSWDHPVSLIGEKVLSPRIHTCDLCKKFILIYGRMIPCKHVFCLWCAKGESDRACARCGERVARVEQASLGTVYMCTFSMNDGLCKRTYLSQRDLQAHIDHRHMKLSTSKDESKEDRMSHRDPRSDSRGNEPRRPDPRSAAVPSNDPRVSNKENFENRDQTFSQFPRSFNPNQPPPSSHAKGGPGGLNVSHHIPVMTTSRTNLITVPIQDGSEQPPSHPPPYSASHNSHPPPPNHPPPQHNPHVSHPSHGQHSQHNPLSHPPPAHPFTSPPPISHAQPPPYTGSVTASYTYTATAQPQYAYPPAGAPQPPPVPAPVYSTSIPPVPVPPPTTYGSRPPQYDGQYATSQWSTPPPQPPTALSRPPPGPPHHHPPSQSGPYFR